MSKKTSSKINLTRDQASIVRQTASMFLLDAEYAYIEIALSGVSDAIDRNLISRHPTKRPVCNHVCFAVPSEMTRPILEEIAEWQYGEIYDYLDANGIAYDVYQDADLHNLRLDCFMHRLCGRVA